MYYINFFMNFLNRIRALWPPYISSGTNPPVSDSLWVHLRRAVFLVRESIKRELSGKCRAIIRGRISSRRRKTSREIYTKRRNLRSIQDQGNFHMVNSWAYQSVNLTIIPFSLAISKPSRYLKAFQPSQSLPAFS